MNTDMNNVLSSPAELLGDAHPLLEQLGSPEELAAVSALPAPLAFARITDVPALRRFLDTYRAQILVPLELPAIIAAHGHASRGEVRELIALDTQLAHEPMLRPFALASGRVGQRQLSKLRPMRDQRVVQRYLAALADGQARGWHTLVYGLSLAMFSLPLRQGLQHYAEQTMRGFLTGAARPLHLSEIESDALLAECFSTIPAMLGAVLETHSLLRVGL